MSQRERRIYDHRIKTQIIAAGDPTLFPELGIPRSTAVLLNVTTSFAPGKVWMEGTSM